MELWISGKYHYASKPTLCLAFCPFIFLQNNSMLNYSVHLNLATEIHQEQYDTGSPTKGKLDLKMIFFLFLTYVDHYV